ncbi:MAG: RNA polymerase factor sigma-54 [Rhodospirillales bacterium]
MSLAPRLEQRQGQNLVMTPQLQQAIKLLQLSNIELAEYVTEELEKNPLLEREDAVVEALSEPAPAEPVEPAPEGATPESAASEDGGLQTLDFSAEAPSAAAERAMDVETEAQSPGEGPGGPAPDGPAYADTRSSSGGFDETGSPWEERVAGAVTLRDYLTGQLALAAPDARDRMIGVYLIDGLDDSGYLGESVEQAAQNLGVEPAQVEALRLRLRGCDPLGVFARDLADCLAVQLEDRNAFDPAMRAMVENLDLVAKREFSQLEEICGVDREDILDMIKEIKTLDPKPARGFDGAEAQPVIPDVLLRARPGGGWAVELNPETLPRVLVNRRYYAEIEKQVTGAQDKRYLAENLQSANWLVRALHQRATTIMKVAEEIVRRQDGFFRHGVAHLRPMILRDVAEAVEMHESTVSRVTANKYIAAPRGNFELKYFFTGAVAAAGGGEAHSSESVRRKIRDLIDAEDVGKILSDDALVKALRTAGVDIARRTVAKYRESLNIPSSVERRRLKSAPR